jgi:hypothetical protein
MLMGQETGEEEFTGPSCSGLDIALANLPLNTLRLFKNLQITISNP